MADPRIVGKLPRSRFTQPFWSAWQDAWQASTIACAYQVCWVIILACECRLYLKLQRS